MRIISHRKLKEFYESPGREDSKVALERWYQIVEEAEWHNFSDIRADFPDADYVGNQHYVFNIRGNNYRLVVVIKFTIGRLFVRFVEHIVNTTKLTVPTFNIKNYGKNNKRTV